MKGDTSVLLGVKGLSKVIVGGSKARNVAIRVLSYRILAKQTRYKDVITSANELAVSSDVTHSGRENLHQFLPILL